MSERIAVIDLGSNSARLIIVEIQNNGAYNLIYHHKETVRLSQGADKNLELQPEAMARAIVALKTFEYMCKLYGTDKILAVGTAAIRTAHNGTTFVKKVQEETGITLRIISGQSEATLGYIGTINSLEVTDALLFDLGGGSTELTLIKNRKAENVISLPFGAVNLTERFNLENKASNTQLSQLHDFIIQYLDNIPWLKKIKLPLIGIGGTARNIAKMEQKRNNYPFPRIHNYRTDTSSFNALWKDITKMSRAERRKIPGLSNERADIIVPGLAIVKCLFETTKSNQLILSSYGVREGLFMQYYLSHTKQEDVVTDPLMHSAHNMLLFYKGNTHHAYHVAKLADDLFDDWQQVLNLKPNDKILLKVAALLHDTGININYYDHARHSAYLVENARLFGISHREQIMTAIIAGWHHSSSTKYIYNKLYNEFLDADHLQKARKLALLLALAESLDATEKGLVEKVTSSFKGNQAQLILTSSQDITMEEQAVKKQSKLLKRETNFELIVKT